MNVLAFYPSYKLSNHDCCVAIARDGELVYAYEEQKLSRVNYRESKYFPDRAALSALYTSKIDPRDIDLICVAGPNAVRDPLEVFQRLEKYFGISCKRVVACSHHTAHTALSVLGSGLTSCTYWTLDAGGEDGTFGEFGRFDDNSFSRLYTLERPSLATFYQLLTGCCGFSDFEEGKVMGLAAYGAVDGRLYDRMATLFEFDDSGHALFTGETVYEYPEIRWDKFSHDEFRPYKVVQYIHPGLCPRLKEMTREHLPVTMAATGQRLVQDLAIESLRRMVQINGLEMDALALGGGFFQNVIANKEIRKSFDCEVFVPPAVSDMGLAAGAALWASMVHDPKAPGVSERRRRPVSPFLGPSFSMGEVEDLLERFPVKFERVAESEAATIAATQIAERKVVGWFQGRGEFGARALGARSVLADPRDPNSKARVNQLLKKRDWFMPYAPSILHEYAHEYMADYSYAPYMTMAFDSVASCSEIIPAAVHVDGTVRPHCVSSEDQPLFHRLISEFMRLTGVPMVLNTSFNRHGVPIVATPRQAIEHLLEGVVDILIVGCFVISRSGSRPEKDHQLIPESILETLLGVRTGYQFLQKGDASAAEAIFRQTGYDVRYSDNNSDRRIWLNGIGFDMGEVDWEEIAASLAREQILPSKPHEVSSHE